MNTKIKFRRWANTSGTETVTFDIPESELPKGFENWTDEDKTEWLFDNGHDENAEWRFFPDEIHESEAWIETGVL